MKVFDKGFIMIHNLLVETNSLINSIKQTNLSQIFIILGLFAIFPVHCFAAGTTLPDGDLAEMVLALAKGARFIAILAMGGIGSMIFLEVANKDERQGKEKLKGLITGMVGLAIIWAIMQFVISTTGTNIEPD